jgi:hypothetical protein
MAVISQLGVSGSISISGGSLSASSSGEMYLVTGTGTIATSGKTIPWNLYIQTGTWTLADALTISKSLNLTNASFNASTYNVTAASFVSTGSLSRTLSMGSGTWTLSAASSAWGVTSTGMTLNKGSANIVLSNSSTAGRFFNGGGFTYNDLTIGGGSPVQITTLSGNNTFSALNLSKTGANTVKFTAGSTTTVSSITAANAAGTLVTLTSTTTSQFTLQKASGSVDLKYASIQYCNATGGAAFNAPTGRGNVDAGNNTGWNFSTANLGFSSFF